MSAHEVVVVGAGPAGSTAARRLAAAGVRVLVLDTARFPRPKVCGGALSPRVLGYAPAGIERQFRTGIRRAVFSYCAAQPFEVVADRPLGYTVRREEFDFWLLERAAAAGAAIRDGARVQAVERDGERILLRVSGERVRARLVIGADGANSIVAEGLCPHDHPPPLLALQAEMASPWPHGETARVDVGRYPRGYAWAFPVGDRVNIGVMLGRAHGRRLEEALARFLAGAACLPGGHPGGAKAAPVAGFRDGAGGCAAPGVLLVGDAARLADPFLGEGIYYAMWSGSLAADAVLAGGDGEAIAGRYGTAVAGTIWPELRMAGRIAFCFHCMPRWWFRLLSRLPRGILRYAGVLAGEESYRGLVRRLLVRLEGGTGRWVGERLGIARKEERSDSKRCK
ncbi:MAG: geranylgeranyl reductase family protein [candidate division NC10 bacterium]|nr:geranylgeranyl reductase family protein [candidate division NC10 bacterium]